MLKSKICLCSSIFLDELRSDDASVRERIVRNWWLLGDSDPQFVEQLRAALQDESDMVRASAAASSKRLENASGHPRA